MDNKIRITLISDTHSDHDKLNQKLIGGDVLIHAGDISSRGTHKEVSEFITWFNSIDSYKQKIFIAGNHDYLFQDNPKEAEEIISKNPNVTYLQDSHTFLNTNQKIKVWGTPWQPEFGSWAFNLKREGEEIKKKWEEIPEDTDLLITHGPPFGRLDWVTRDYKNVGSVELSRRLEVVKPKIHVFGHVHEGYGYTFDGLTHYINASMIGGNHVTLRNEPINIEWEPNKNKINFL